jgi:hypothetical protein
MDRNEIQPLLEKLAGQEAPLDGAPAGLSIFEGPGAELGYSQLNELLLLFGLDRITHGFFRYLLDGEIEYEPGLAFDSAERLIAGVDRFRELAVLLYGNVKFGFKSLSQDTDLLQSVLRSLIPIDEASFMSRHRPILPLHEIEADDAYLTGYLIERELRERLAGAPGDLEAVSLEAHRKKVVAQAKANQDAYLVSDHLDVYVATSMREKHEFSAIRRITSEIFNHRAIRELKLRWFDPTQAYCHDRVDKGLSEALMLRRASCTVYLAQESDTLGKDSELASTLAQGKPVVAYIPDVTDEYFESHMAGLRAALPNEPEIASLLAQLRIYEPAAAWNDSVVQAWCADPQGAATNEVRERVLGSMRSQFDRRATTLRDSHPLGIQANLQTGVANGVLVVRSVEHCARLIRNIVLQSLEFELRESHQGLELREKISGCIFRVMSKDSRLTNTFWNFYIEPAD